MTLVDPGMLAWSVPLVLAAAALVALGGTGPSRAWWIAEGSALVAALIAAVAAALALLAPTPADAAGHLMTVLIGTLGWVIVRYSRQYLTGEPGQTGYIAALMATLAAVSVVVLADHLGVLVAAWVTSSLALHQLLVHYRERTAARIAAHKKFLSNRLSELCLLAALGLVWSETGSLSISALATHLGTVGYASPGLQFAAALFAIAAILRCALLPVHGWLIQVMEAPTPVSALLHAGVVNLGGFVMIRLAALISEAPFAQALLVVIGATTAVLAGLVMMTRISIKVRLAWSTCAQMGFMLMQCGLGLYELAMLHLVAHSLYKAHAFLRAGETVADARRAAMAPQSDAIAPAARAMLRALAAPVAIAVVAASVFAWQLAGTTSATPWVVVLIVGLGLAPLLWQAEGRGMTGFVGGLAAIALLAHVYLVWHHLFGTLAPTPSAPPDIALAVFVAVVFAALYALQSWLLAYPRGSLSRRLHPVAYAGFWLDESYTRLAFRLWPARLPDSAVPTHFEQPTGERA
jgi:NAD(P)H-quinone oxidoreductase subunit 5